MLRKNIAGLSLWGWPVCVGIFPFNYVVDEVLGAMPNVHYPRPAPRLPWPCCVSAAGLPEGRTGGCFSASRCTVGASQLDICP